MFSSQTQILIPNLKFLIKVFKINSLNELHIICNNVFPVFDCCMVFKT